MSQVEDQVLRLQADTLDATAGNLVNWIISDEKVEVGFYVEVTKQLLKPPHKHDCDNCGVETEETQNYFVQREENWCGRCVDSDGDLENCDECGEEFGTSELEDGLCKTCVAKEETGN